MEYTPGRSATWGHAVRRAVRALKPGSRRPSTWSFFVPLIAMLAGLLFATTARTAAGTNLRNDRGPELTRLIEVRRQQVNAENRTATALRKKIDAATSAQAGSDSRIAAQQDRISATRQGAGFTALHGPGLTVRLDDAPRQPDGTLPAGARPDDVVVHQQDVQSVVNALWAGGAEAMSIMDVRVVSTSAVRCVGNTLLLQGQVYSPPFKITAIGNPTALQAALDAAGGVQAFRDAAQAWGLGYQVTTETDVTIPAYDGNVSLEDAKAVR